MNKKHSCKRLLSEIGRIGIMIDIQFIEFYIKKKYNQSMVEYFDVSKPVLSVWRHKSFPGGRLKEFLEREGNLDPHILFDRIYQRGN